MKRARTYVGETSTGSTKKVKKNRQGDASCTTVLRGSDTGTPMVPSEAVRSSSKEVSVTPLPASAPSESAAPVEKPSSTSSGSAHTAASFQTVYRLMHQVPRSDVLRLCRCALNYAHCEYVAKVFREEFLQHPVRQLTLQVGCRSDAPSRDTTERKRSGGKTFQDGFQLFFPLIFHHRFCLKELDLSRNDLCAKDVQTLCRGLGIEEDGNKDKSSGGVMDKGLPTKSTSSSLRLLNLSYNRRIGNEGVISLFSGLARSCDRAGNHSFLNLRAVILRCVGVDDDGAVVLAQYLRHRPPPLSSLEKEAYEEDSFRTDNHFFVNLNENRIGARGTYVLGKGLPSYVSLSLCKQVVRPTKIAPSLLVHEEEEQ